MSDSSEEPPGQWQQIRKYVDHLGHPVVLEQYVEPDYPPAPIHQVPIPVYSNVVPLDPDHEKLRRYLLNIHYEDEIKPLFEVYSFCPSDAFAASSITDGRLPTAKSSTGQVLLTPLP